MLVKIWKYSKARPLLNSKNPYRTRKEYYCYCALYKVYFHSKTWEDFAAEQINHHNSLGKTSKVG